MTNRSLLSPDSKMLHFRNAILLVTIISVVDGSPLTMYDDRVRGLDVTPALGRGYNVGTNKFHSACHNAEEKISPTYNYDCKCLFSSILFRYQA